MMRPLAFLPAVMLAACATSPAQTAATCEATHPRDAAWYRGQLLSPDSTHVMIAAHRACWQGAPENSIAAIEACIGVGVDMVELDVRRSSDGVLVVVHDTTLDRTTVGTGAVSERTADELTALRLRDGAGGPDAPLTSETLPLLSDALEATRGRILVNIDAKEDVIVQAMDLVEAMDLGEKVLMKAVVDPAELDARLEPISDRAFFMPIVWERDSAAPLSSRILPYAPAEPVAFEVVYDSPGYLAAGRTALEDANVRIWANTMLPKYAAGLADEDAVNDPASVWGVLVEQGVDMIQTDRPVEAIDYLSRIGRRCGQ